MDPVSFEWYDQELHETQFYNSSDGTQVPAWTPTFLMPKIPSDRQLSHPLASFSLDICANSPTCRTVERLLGRLDGISSGMSVEYEHVSVCQNGCLDIQKVSEDVQQILERTDV